MSDRLLAMGIAESVHRMTPVTRSKHTPRRHRIGRAASLIGWFALIGCVLTVLRAFA